MSVQEVGQIRYFSSTHINWQIPQFSDLLQKNSYRIWSPKFAYPGENKIYVYTPPKWTEYLPDTTFVKMSLTSDAIDRGNINYVRVGVTDESGNLIDFCNCVWNSSYAKSFDGMNLIRANEIAVREKGEIPGYLRLYCEIPKQTCCKQFVNVAIQTKTENDSEKLHLDFKTLLNSNKDSDLTIKVKGREFNVHRIILRARSSVFDSMLSHNLKENKEGVITIEDCEPDIFEEFLHFVYSGEVQNINSGNVSGLYYAADKYNIQYLKKMCVNFLTESFSVENICEIICLATKHTETNLLKCATDYFAENLDEILITCNWLQFMKDNPVKANELYIKSLKLCYLKRDKRL